MALERFFLMWSSLSISLRMYLTRFWLLRGALVSVLWMVLVGWEGRWGFLLFRDFSFWAETVE